MRVSADLIIPAADAEELSAISSWDGLRAATFSRAEFPVDAARFHKTASPLLFLARARRTESLKALPVTLRSRAEEAFERAARRPTALSLARGRVLDLGAGPAVMGVLNVTPDSFSDGGLYLDTERAVARGLEMFEQGAAIVDVGGESTRPATYGASLEVSESEEIGRVLPVIASLRKTTDLPISIDTRRAAVARAALAAGADLINDVSALRHDPEMAQAAAEAAAGLLLMHMKGMDPRTMQEDVAYAHPLADIAAALAEAAGRALEAGVAADRIAVDPGLGFGKSAEGNLLLLRYLSAFRTLGFPVAAGASRKAFVRRFSGVSESASLAERLPGSLAAAAAAVEKGAAIVRVHDVAETVGFLAMRRAIEAARAPRLDEAAVR